MGLITCSECGKKISTEAKYCPHCGVPAKKQAEIQRGCLQSSITAIFVGIFLIFVVVLIVMFIVSSSNDIKRKSTPSSVNYLYTKLDCNIRSGPGTKYSVVRVASKGNRLQFTSLKGSWYKLRMRTGKSEEWVHKSVVSRKPASKASQRSSAPKSENRSKDKNGLIAKKGKGIYEAIQQKYPEVALIPMFFNCAGSSGSNCSVMIQIPEKEWDVLSETDRKSLEVYAKSIVHILRANPKNYIPFKGYGTQSDWYATGNPVWEKLYSNCRNVCDDCWQIRVGRISDRFVAGFKDILDDRRVAKGENRSKDKNGLIAKKGKGISEEVYLNKLRSAPGVIVVHKESSTIWVKVQGTAEFRNRAQELAEMSARLYKYEVGGSICVRYYYGDRHTIGRACTY